GTDEGQAGNFHFKRFKKNLQKIAVSLGSVSPSVSVWKRCVAVAEDRGSPCSKTEKAGCQ
ncbi:hypothetical protein CMK14_12490, partial [Candidatus Poribacteria bacterium]|nr:hypothetical protein [Candidatus Poribacteria bacterium]